MRFFKLVPDITGSQPDLRPADAVRRHTADTMWSAMDGRYLAALIDDIRHNKPGLEYFMMAADEWFGQMSEDAVKRRYDQHGNGWLFVYRIPEYADVEDDKFEATTEAPPPGKSPDWDFLLQIATSLMR